jgi:nucleoside-diphosphate-sugar epimerase
MTTVILGYTGFVGKHIFNYLKKKKFLVLGGNTKNCNLLKKKNIKNFFKKKDKINLIICSSLTRSKEDTVKSFNKNILMILNLINVIDREKINKVIFLSSIDVYKINGKLRENISKTNPITKYGKYKLIAEDLLKKNFSKKKLVILRLSGVYDENINGKNMISYIKRGLKRGHLEIQSSGYELRDYVHANDVAKVIYLFLKSNSYGIFNLASGVSKNIKYYVKRLIKKYPSSNLKISYNNKNHLKDIEININKLKKVFSVLKLKKI